MLRKTFLIAATIYFAQGTVSAYGQFAESDSAKSIRIRQNIKNDVQRLSHEQIGIYINSVERDDPIKYCDVIPAYSGCVAKKASDERRKKEAQELAVKEREEQRKELLNKVRFPVLETKLIQAVSYRVHDLFGIEIEVQVRCKKAGTGLIRVRPFQDDVPKPTETKTIKCVLAEDVLDVSFKTSVADRYLIDFPIGGQKK